MRWEWPCLYGMCGMVSCILPCINWSLVDSSEDEEQFGFPGLG